MKLNSAQLERTLGQFEARPIPDDHPLIPQLNDLFGEHTFFLDGRGPNIVEPVGGRGFRRGRESGQLERRQPVRSGGARARVDRRGHHARIEH